MKSAAPGWCIILKIKEHITQKSTKLEIKEHRHLGSIRKYIKYMYLTEGKYIQALNHNFKKMYDTYFSIGTNPNPYCSRTQWG